MGTNGFRWSGPSSRRTSVPFLEEASFRSIADITDITDLSRVREYNKQLRTRQ